MANLELHGAGRRFGDRVALDGVHLTLREGEIVAVIGPSGGGKSTLLRLLAGSLRPTSGRVLVGGTDLAGFSAKELRGHRARCAQIAQGGMLVPQLSAHDNVLAGRLPRWSAARVLLSRFMILERDPIRVALEEVGLGDRQWDRTGNLSGGEQQRVAIARALAGEPEWLFADEPTASLDPTTAQDMARHLVAAARSHDATLVLSTHWMEFVSEHAQRVIGLREGRVVFDRAREAIDSVTLDALYEGSRERR
jgi:phosphonate transport system ATP-binding protein